MGRFLPLYQLEVPRRLPKGLVPEGLGQVLAAGFRVVYAGGAALQALKGDADRGTDVNLA